MALFVRKFGRFMKKKGYGARKRIDNNKSKDYVRRCYKCKSPDHIVVDCPYNNDNDEDEKKKHKKEKKEKKERRRWPSNRRRRVEAMWSLRIVMALQIVMTLVMMARNVSIKH